ncbi:dipeptide ABC transporter ATP-binding protein [Paracoccus cavernae]|uniref:ABC transporter ATP-binding protein n=2 Tax=Paracoccus cavernae TaxID=1571207 RepID=UPI0035F4A2FD
MAVLELDNLTTSFRGDDGWKPVVRNVSFSIDAGETLAVVGESGSGKSVTAMSIMRLLQPGLARHQGRILFEGWDLLTLPETQMQQIRGNRIAMIFQEPMTSLNPVMTIGDQIDEALMIHRGLSASAARKETLQLLEKVRIPAASRRADDYPHLLSGGMRQRVMIAVALACRPKLLIADEPTTALDVTIQAQITQLIKELQQEEDMAVLFITHDMGVVAEIADRVTVMYRGDIVETGATDPLFAAPRQPYTRALLAAVPALGKMGATTRPKRFDLVDAMTGLAAPAAPTIDTVGPEPVLQVRNLVTRFDIRGGLRRRAVARVHAIENVSFDLNHGETLALVGESGCGKSTTGRALMRMVHTQAGSVRLQGQEILGAGVDLQALRRSIQMIFQDPYASLNPRRKVGAAIAEPLLIHKVCTPREAMARARALLEEVGLSGEMADRYPHEFSGGQRQRVCIARALTLEPKLIIADESVSALDVSIKAQVLNLMLDLQERKRLSYLFISHDMAVVERVSHRVAVMYSGEIVEIGPRAEIFNNPRHPYTRRLIDAVPIPDPTLRRVRGGMDTSDIRSPLRHVDYQPPLRHYDEVSAGHFVMADAQ